MMLKIKMKVWDERVIQGISLRDLAKFTGIPKSTLNRIENNKVMPRLDHIILISMALKIDIKKLYEIRISRK